MSEIAIKVEGLSKRYRIGGSKERYYTLRDTLTNAFIAPFRRLRSTSKRSNIQTFQPSNDNYIWALKDVSFEVKQGEVVGIIGRNGAGKTTLLKILSRITEPTEGQATLYGRVGSLLEVGTGFHPELTGRENIYLSAAILGMKKAEIKRKFDEIVAFAELEKFIDTPVKRYSSGMYVRLAFAVAAHLEPEILLVDEVLAVGDAAFQKKCLGKMGDVAKEGRTVLFVSHNMGAIQRLCYRTFLLADGRLVLHGETHKVIQKYLADSIECTPSTKSLESLPRTNGLGELIKFSECSILNSQGDLKNHILFGESFTIFLKAMARTRLENLSVIVGIDSFLGGRITTIASEDSNVLFSISPEQPLQVQVHIDSLMLKPGLYWLTLGIRQGRMGLDHLPHAMQLEVKEVSTSNTQIVSDTWGVIHTPAHWKAL